MRIGIVSDSHDNVPLIINPGECGGWVTGRCTAALLDTETMVPELFELRKP